MRPHTLLFFALVLLGAVAALSPALANAAEMKLEVNQNCVDPEWPCWTTEGSALRPQPALAVKIAAGDEVMFTDHDASTPAAVVWMGSAPACTGVPTSAMTNWEGKCTFVTSGVYKFESSTLFDEENTLYGKANYRKYEIVVAGTPTDLTTSASGETQTEAMLNGSIDPEGNTVEYHFEYEGPGVIGKQSTPTATLSEADFTSHSVSVQVTGLEPGMIYHFQLVATYGVGKTSVSGATQMFKTHAVTAPTATTLAAEGFKETEVTLKGTVNPGGEATEYFFEYGTDTHYGLKTETATLQASGGSNQGVSATLKGLAPGTEYHFRLVAKNKQSPAGEGLDRSFTTASPPAKEPPAKEPSPTPTPTTGGNPAAITSSSPSSEQPKTEPAPSPLFGSVKLASTQHGGVVHGSLVVSSAGSGGQLQIELLAKGANAPVGKLARSLLHAGKLTFALPLNAKGKAALRRHRRLTLTVKITLTPQHGAAVTVTRGVGVRA